MQPRCFFPMKKRAETRRGEQTGTVAPSWHRFSRHTAHAQVSLFSEGRSLGPRPRLHKRVSEIPLAGSGAGGAVPAAPAGRLRGSAAVLGARGASATAPSKRTGTRTLWGADVPSAAPRLPEGALLPSQQPQPHHGAPGPLGHRFCYKIPIFRPFAAST